jgi:hypothetical protein
MPPVARNARVSSRGAARVIRNASYVTRRKRLAKWSALFGLALLGATFWLALNPQRILLSYVTLLGGTVLFHYGMQQTAKWNAHNDANIDTVLRNLGERYTLIHYVEIGKRTIEHLLVHPGGALILTAREVPGTIVYRNNRWRKEKAGIGRLFGMGGPQLGDPARETQANVGALSDYLADAQLEMDVDGAIVFLNPHVKLEVEEPDFPVMNTAGLSGYVRGLPEDESLRVADRQALVGLLEGAEHAEQTKPTPRRRPVRRRAA